MPGTPALRAEQIKLQLALVNALMHVKGYAAPEPKAAVEQARQFIERRCIGEAMTAVETTKERWYEAEINRIRGEIALKLPQLGPSQAEAYFERACAAGEILGVARGDEHGAALARAD